MLDYLGGLQQPSNAVCLGERSHLGIDRRFWADMLSREVVTS